MDMHSIQFSPSTNDFIAQQLQTGAFDNEAELLEAAVQCLRLNTLGPGMQPKVTFEEAVMAGVADIEAGRCTELTEERLEELIQRGIDQAKSDNPFRGDCAALPLF